MVSARTLRRHRRQCQPRDAVPKGTVSQRISRWCTGRIQLVDATPRYFGGVRWGTGSSSWRFVAIGVRFPRRDGRRWLGGRTGGRGGGCCGGDDRECSRRCRRVVAGWFSVVPPCWRRESTTARDGFGVATCPQMSAERIRLRATAPRRQRAMRWPARDPGASRLARPRHRQASSSRHSVAALVVRTDRNRRPTVRPKVRRRLPWSSNDLAVHHESARAVVSPSARGSVFFQPRQPLAHNRRAYRGFRRPARVGSCCHLAYSSV